jgi:hypothetical protein
LTDNVAKGTTATAVSEFIGFPVASLTDGFIDTCFRTELETSPWVLVELDAIYKIQSVVVAIDSPRGLPLFQTSLLFYKIIFSDALHQLCFNTNTKGSNYAGAINTTNSGLPCQRWDSRTPHLHVDFGYYFPEGSSTLGENYCRNSLRTESAPYCYTQDPDIRSGFCAVPPCGKT